PRRFVGPEQGVRLGESAGPVLGGGGGAARVDEARPAEDRRAERSNVERQVRPGLRAFAAGGAGADVEAVAARGRAGLAVDDIAHLEHGAAVAVVAAFAEQSGDVERSDPQE